MACAAATLPSTRRRMADETHWARDFREEGALATALPGYEARPQQREMAERVAAALHHRTRLVIEAPTGTGKTLAYLLPVLRSGYRSVISTATKSLQEQLMRKDRAIASHVLGREVDMVLLKGRQNYLCLLRLEETKADPQPVGLHERSDWDSVVAWSDRTETGDRAELANLPEGSPLWGRLTVGAEACLGSACPHHDACFVRRARERAQNAEVVIVNHHLFFADLSLRGRLGVELLPRYDALVFDEAHHLEHIAADFFGEEVSNWRYRDLLGDVERFVAKCAQQPGMDLEAAEAASLVLKEHRRAMERSRTFFDAVAQALGSAEARVVRSALWPEGLPEDLGGLFGDLCVAMADVSSALLALNLHHEERNRLRQRVGELEVALRSLLVGDSDDHVYEVERRGERGVFFRARPVEVAALLQQELHAKVPSMVLASATLAVQGRFHFVLDRLGLPPDTETCRLEPVFDYPTQAMLYVPSDLPQPNAPNFIDEAVAGMEALVQLTEGRALLLFTSYRNMRRAHALLRGRWRWPTYHQEEGEKNALLERFRRETSSVLFATQSFWEGIDVPGEALSLLIIDKLPFASPQEPLLQARSARLDAKLGSGAGFREYQLPQAILALKQGFGRLIRTRQDRGIVAVFDRRLAEANYRGRFLTSLPPARRTRDIDVVRAWWRGDDQDPSVEES